MERRKRTPYERSQRMEREREMNVRSKQSERAAGNRGIKRVICGWGNNI